VPSALTDQTSSWLSKTMRPDSEVTADVMPFGLGGDALGLTVE
jgi:hypothetical protein